jgi:hypothetical protein
VGGGTGEAAFPPSTSSRGGLLLADGGDGSASSPVRTTRGDVMLLAEERDLEAPLAAWRGGPEPNLREWEKLFPAPA